MTTLIAVWMVVLGVGCMLIRLVGILAVVLYGRHVAAKAADRQRDQRSLPPTTVTVGSASPDVATSRSVRSASRTTKSAR